MKSKIYHNWVIEIMNYGNSAIILIIKCAVLQWCDGSLLCHGTLMTSGRKLRLAKTDFNNTGWDCVSIYELSVYVCMCGIWAD